MVSVATCSRSTKNFGNAIKPPGDAPSTLSWLGSKVGTGSTVGSVVNEVGSGDDTVGQNGLTGFLVGPVPLLDIRIIIFMPIIFLCMR